MKLLIDANLSWRLKKKFANLFSEIIHAEELKFSQPVSDKQIWNYAKENNFIIMTNDDDFMTYSILFSFPPKIILIRTGNQSTNFIADLITAHISDITSMNASEDYGILELY